MTADIHALVLTRVGAQATADLGRTLAALRRQTRPVQEITIVVGGPIDSLRSDLEDSGAARVMEAAAGASLAQAAERALPHVPESAALWYLLAGDEPESDALSHLAAALERGPSVAIAAPKLIDAADGDRIVSYGQSMTRFGRTVELADGEFDQGQYDARDDVLGAQLRGSLVRGPAVQAVAPDTALLGADEGLDLGVRAHLAGRRVALASGARVAVAEEQRPRRARATYRARTAQLHRRLSYAPLPLALLHWLSLIPLAVWTTVVRLIGKAPSLLPAEWAATLTALVRLPAIARSRRRIRTWRTTSWTQLAPLRVDRVALREREGMRESSAAENLRGELRFFSGGGAWLVLGALAASVTAFFSLLGWQGIGGGGLAPLRRTVAALWADAASGMRPDGFAAVGPADPFSGVIALLGTLWPAAPSFIMLLIWILALPLAALGAWFAATRVSIRPSARMLVGVGWALSPTLLAALIDPRPAAVLAHLLLPWLVFAGAAAHRSWGSAGVASLLFAATLACAPSVGPALLVMWAIAFILTVIFRARGIARMIWLLVPAAAVFLPLITAQVAAGIPMAILADPGPVWVFSAAESSRVLTGFPSADPGGWRGFLGDDALASWAPVLLVPVVLLALLAPLCRRWRAGVFLVVSGGIAAVSAMALTGVAVAHLGGETVPVWIGTAMGLAWMALLLGAAVTVDVGVLPRPVLRIVGGLAMACLLVAAVPSITAVARGESSLVRAGDSTLPAYVAAQAGPDRDVGTLVVDPLVGGEVAARIVWGTGETLGGAATVRSTRLTLNDDDRRLAAIAAALVTGSSSDIGTDLRSRGVAFVLLTPEAADDAARRLRLEATTVVDQRAGFLRVGETERGVLWRLDGEVSDRAEPSAQQRALGQTAITVELVALLVALLLALPTPSARRASRRASRAIATRFEEEL